MSVYHLSNRQLFAYSCAISLVFINHKNVIKTKRKKKQNKNKLIFKEFSYGKDQYI